MYSRGMKAYCFSIPVVGFGEDTDEAFSYALEALADNPIASIHNQEVTWEEITDDKARLGALMPMMAENWPSLPPRA